MRVNHFLRTLLYALPVVLWMAFILVYSAGERGQYTHSLFLLQSVILHLAPEFPYTLDHGMLIEISMYQLNAAFRLLAHVFVYAILTLLIVRWCQSGRERLRPVSLVAATLLSAMYVGVDEWKRCHEPNRHAKIGDLYLDLVGVALVLGGTILFFAIKGVECRLTADGAAKAEPDKENKKSLQNH